MGGWIINLHHCIVAFVHPTNSLCRPPEDLWSFFDSFSESHVAAMAPCMYHYGSPRNKVPFYGETGLNAGIMHMDLQVSIMSENKYKFKGLSVIQNNSCKNSSRG